MTPGVGGGGWGMAGQKPNNGGGELVGVGGEGRNLMSARQLAEALGVDRHGIIDSWIPAGCPVAQQRDRTKGKPWLFDLAAVFEWYGGGSQAGAGAGQGQELLDYQAELARKTREQADILSMRKLQLRGDLVRVSDVAAAWADEVAIVRSRVMALPSTIAGDVVGMTDVAALERRIKSHLVSALSGLSGAPPAPSPEPEDGAPAEDDDDA